MILDQKRISSKDRATNALVIITPPTIVK